MTHQAFDLQKQSTLSIIGATDSRAALDKSGFLFLSITYMHPLSSRSRLRCAAHVDFDAGFGTMSQTGVPCAKSGGRHGLDPSTQTTGWRRQLPCARAKDAGRNLLSWEDDF